MDSLHRIAKIADSIVLTGQLLSVRHETFHLRLRTTITKLQVIEHRIITACQALIRLLDRTDIRAHLVSIIGHILHSGIAELGRRLSVTAKRLDKRSAEAGDGIHILVSAHSSRLIGVISVILHDASGILEKRLHAAHKLLVLRVRFDGLLADTDDR